MRVAFTEEQTMLRDMLRIALEREAPLPALRAWCEAADFTVFETVVRDNGWAGIGTDDAAGGQGGGLIEQALLFEALGHQAAPSGGLLAQVAALCVAAQAGVGAAEMVALVEAAPMLVFDARSALDIHPAQAPVRVLGDRLQGGVPVALHAGTPALGSCLFAVPEGDGTALWLAAPGAPGLSTAPSPMVDRTRAFAAMHLDGVPARCIGRLTAAAMVQAQARLAVLLAAESLGLARRMLSMTTAYVAQRVQFGVPVGSFQAVKHEAAQVLVDLEAAHSGIYYAAWALDEREDDGLMHAWIAKAFACEAAARTADRALMLHGAIGYTLEYDLQFFFKRAKLNVELLGPPRHYRERIACALPLLPA